MSKKIIVNPFWSTETNGLPPNLNLVESKSNGETLELNVEIDPNRQSIGLKSDQAVGTPLIYWIEIIYPSTTKYKIITKSSLQSSLKL